MESGYEFDSLSELPPLPQQYDPMEYSTYYPYAVTPLDSLPPFPPSDFEPYGGVSFSDHDRCLLQLQQNVADSFFLESTLSLLTRNNHTESTRLEKLFPDDAAAPFLRLPDLKSFEKTTAEDSEEDTKPLFLSLAPPLLAARHGEKRRRRGSVVKRTLTISPSSSSNSRSSAPSSLLSCPSIYGAGRSMKISDRIRSLEKLMPWEKKMSLADILEETHKYITFLHSQIASFRWMPLESVYRSAASAAGNVEETSPLRSLTRQQILQVIANSPGARTELYTRGVCLFSYEQLLSVKMMSESARNL